MAQEIEPPADFLQLVNNLNSMVLVVTYTPSWHRRSKHQIPDRVKRKNGFMIHSMRPSVSTPLPDGTINVKNIHTDRDRGHDIKLPLNPPPANLKQDLDLYWSALADPQRSYNSQETFHRLQYKKHMKYFHTHDLYKRVNMWVVAMEMGQNYVSARGPLNLMKIILDQYQIGEVINCEDFVNFLRRRLGRGVKVTFCHFRGMCYLYKIHILFSLERVMIDYLPDDQGCHYGNFFTLEGDFALLQQEMQEEMQEEVHEEMHEEDEQEVDEEGDERDRGYEQICSIQVEQWMRQESLRRSQAAKKRLWNWKKPFDLFRMCYGRN